MIVPFMWSPNLVVFRLLADKLMRNSWNASLRFGIWSYAERAPQYEDDHSFQTFIFDDNFSLLSSKIIRGAAALQVTRVGG